MEKFSLSATATVCRSAIVVVDSNHPDLYWLSRCHLGEAVTCRLWDAFEWLISSSAQNASLSDLLGWCGEEQIFGNSMLSLVIYFSTRWWMAAKFLSKEGWKWNKLPLPRAFCRFSNYINMTGSDYSWWNGRKEKINGWSLKLLSFETWYFDHREREWELVENGLGVKCFKFKNSIRLKVRILQLQFLSEVLRDFF